MFGRNSLIAGVALVTFQVALPLFAQEETAQEARRTPTLSQRLQRFRTELLGDEPMPRRTAPESVGRVPRKGIAPPPIAMAPSTSTPSNLMAVPAKETDIRPLPKAAPAASSAVKVPAYLEPQGARRAQGGSVRPAAPLDGATQSLRSKMVPIVRPAEVPKSAATELPADEAASDEPPFEKMPEPQAETEGSPSDEPSSEVTEDAHHDHEHAEHDAQDHADSDVERESTPAEPTPAEPTAANSTSAEPTTAEPTESEPPSAQPTPAEVPQVSRPLDDRIEHGDDQPREDQKTGDGAAARGASDVLFTSKSPVLLVEASGPRSVRIGKEADFLVKVRNAGAAANNVVVSVHIPSDADVAGAQPTAGSAQGATSGEQHDALEWTIDRLEAGGEETLALKLIPRKSSPLDLAVQSTFTPETSQTMVEVQEPKLAMSLSGPNEVLFGETKVYKLTISNPGNGDTENVSVGLLPIGRSGEAHASHRLGTLKAGESKTVDIELTARQAGAITIKAHAAADGELRAEAAEQVLVRRGSLQVEVEAPRIKFAGTAGTFHVRVANVGNATAENVRVSAILPPEAKFTGATGGGKLDEQQSRVEWTVGSLQPGGQRVFDLQCSLAAPGDNRMQFAAAADGDLSAAATSNTRVEAIADLKLEVRDPTGPIAVGDETVYEVRIRNRGTKAAEGVDLVVFFSQGLEATSADGGAHDIGDGQVVFRPIASLGPGDTTVLHVRARATAGGNHVFRAELACQSLDVKLATEEATHFYGELRRPAVDGEGQPHPAAPRQEPPTTAEADEVPAEETSPE